MLRPCLEPGCPHLTPRTRCSEHERARGKRRGSTTQRGYGGEHQKARAALAGKYLVCGYCGVGIAGSWVAAHVVDGDPTQGWMAAHPMCNERAKKRPLFVGARAR